MLANILNCILVLAYFLAYRWVKKRTGFKSFRVVYTMTLKDHSCIKMFNLYIKTSMSLPRANWWCLAQVCGLCQCPSARFLHVCMCVVPRALNVLIESVQLQLYIATR